jgi:uncharacterized protein with HEPN domain
MGSDGGMRNILTHEYGHVNLVLVFQTARDDLPLLVAAIRGILAAQTNLAP